MRNGVYLIFLVLGFLFTLGSMIAFMRREADGATFVALLIGVLFLYYSTVLQKERGPKKCPACAEMVKKEATKCRYCGAELMPDVS